MNDKKYFNYRIGTQTFGPKYKFSNKPGFIETAEQILEMGSNIIKFAISNKFKDGFIKDNLPKDDNITIRDIIEKIPEYGQIFDMPFGYYFFWVSDRESRLYKPWHLGLTEKDIERQYNDVYDFCKYLLTKYEGSGKTFMLGHWEGDWLLLGRTKFPLDVPTDTAIKSMIDWLNIRQKAVDDAKRDCAAKNVYMYNYAEVNLVQKSFDGHKSVTTEVLPNINVDYVSYSCYDLLGPWYREKENKEKALYDSIVKALNFIEQHLPEKKVDFVGKRVFIGEYGFPLIRTKTAELQNEASKSLIKCGLHWGCPYILYWELYNNEVEDDGRHRGFWLINDKNEKQPVYYTHYNFYKKAVEFVKEYYDKNKKCLSDNEFIKQSLSWI